MKLYLLIAQLENYELFRFLRWVLNHLKVKNLPGKKDLVITLKVKIILIISILFIILIPLAFYQITTNIIITFLITIVLITQSYLPISFTLIVLKPFEILSFKFISIKTLRKILKLKRKGLRIIGVTGSYGKTSTKEFLYQILKTQFKVLRTPESFNTIQGVAKTVDYELDNSYEYFVCELSAYKRFDIRTLSRMIKPDIGIITGISKQHLERFGNIRNIVKTKFELYEAIRDKQDIVINTDNKIINEYINTFNLKITEKYLTINSLTFKKGLWHIEFIYQNKAFRVETALFGLSNIENLRGAITMALKLGISIENIQKSVKGMRPVPHRMSTYKMKNATIIDNTYNSNTESFIEIVKTLKYLTGKKVIFTPGIVELGVEESTIHENIGILIHKHFDKYILVGDNNRTRSLAKGIKDNYVYIKDTREEYFNTLDELSTEFDWIFLENDLTQNYI